MDPNTATEHLGVKRGSIMDLTIIGAPGARSWVIACALALALMPLIARAADIMFYAFALSPDAAKH